MTSTGLVRRSVITPHYYTAAPRPQYAQSSNDILNEQPPMSALKWRLWKMLQRLHSWRQKRRARGGGGDHVPPNLPRKEKTAWWIAMFASILTLMQISSAFYLAYVGVHIIRRYNEEYNVVAAETEFATTRYLDLCNKEHHGPTFQSEYLNCTLLYRRKEVNPRSYALESAVYHVIEHFSLFYWIGGCHDAQCTGLLYGFAQYVLTNPFKLIMAASLMGTLVLAVCIYAWWTFVYWHKANVTHQNITQREPVEVYKARLTEMATNPRALDSDFNKAIEEYQEEQKSQTKQQQRLLMVPDPPRDSVWDALANGERMSQLAMRYDPYIPPTTATTSYYPIIPEEEEENKKSASTL
jgi:hypothetical protein